MSGLDHLFGGEPGAAKRTLKGFQRTYGPEKGQTVFDAQVIKLERRSKASGGKKAPPFAKGGKKAPPFTKGGKKRTLAQRLLGG
jgi:hypothetical protein